jgi:hypothetical protein
MTEFQTSRDIPRLQDERAASVCVDVTVFVEIGTFCGSAPTLCCWGVKGLVIGEIIVSLRVS